MSFTRQHSPLVERLRVEVPEVEGFVHIGDLVRPIMDRLAAVPARILAPSLLQRTLLDLGWMALTQRALGGKPAETYALCHLLRCAGRPVALSELAKDYAFAGRDMARAHARAPGSDDAVRKRIERVRAALADMGCDDAIQTLRGQGYLIDKRDVSRVQRAVLFGCGYDLDEDRAA